MKQLFSESTISLSLFKGSQLKNRINNFIKKNDYVNVTASYCILETLNIIMTQTEYLIKKIQKYESLNKALEFINNALPSQRNSYKIWTFNFLRGIYGDDDKDCTERALLSLQNLRLTCCSLLDNFYKEIKNKLGCLLYKDNLKINLGEVKWEMPKCKMNNKKCNIKDFFEDNKKLLIEIKNEIDNLDENKKTKELQGFSDVISKALINPNILFDYKNGCRRIADVLIALESQDIKNFFTQNYKESDVLCKILKQKLYVLSNNFNKEIELKDFS